jgi:hypothetical protein
MQNSRITKFFKTILFFIPTANPDFDHLISNVNEWQLELDTDDPLPLREIGIDLNGKVIIKMPWRNNYGYWTGDNNVELKQFKENFGAIEISKEEFEKNWTAYGSVVHKSKSSRHV